MSIDFISQRLNSMDSYLDKLEANIQGHFGTKLSNVEKKTSEFDQILTTFLGEDAKPEVQKTTEAKIQYDDFSKLPEGFDDYIVKVSKDTAREMGVGIDANLIRSVIKQESGFNPTAKSHAGAEGLMQLMPATAKSVGVFNSTNPYQNVKGGVKYLGQMLKQFGGSLPKALAAYNAGPSAVEKYQGIPPYKETQNYVESIMKDYLAREDYRPVDMMG